MNVFNKVIDDKVQQLISTIDENNTEIKDKISKEIKLVVSDSLKEILESQKEILKIELL